MSAPDASVFCNSCKFQIKSAEQRAAHYRGEWHRYNVKRNCAGLAPVEESLFNEKLAVLKQQQADQGQKGGSAKCDACQKVFKNTAAYEVHLQSKTHTKRVNKKDDKSGDTTPKSKPETKIEELRKTETESKDDDIDDKKDGDEDAEEQEDESEEAKNPIPLKTCLFCITPLEFDDVQSSLDHMLKVHGFFIPFAEFLTSLDGLLEYLGAKVGVGHVCLHCNGRGRAAYSSMRACQQHMLAKNHCKIRFEENEDDDEFLDYYEFPHLKDEQDKSDKTDKSGDADEGDEGDGDEGDADDSSNLDTVSSSTSSNSKALISVPKRRRHLADMLDTGELVLSDGSTIGHRMYNKVYNQNVRPRDDRASVTILQLVNQYRALSLPGYSKSSIKPSERTKSINTFHDKQRLRVGTNNNDTKRMYKRDQVPK